MLVVRSFYQTDRQAELVALENGSPSLFARNSFYKKRGVGADSDHRGKAHVRQAKDLPPDKRFPHVLTEIMHDLIARSRNAFCREIPKLTCFRVITATVAECWSQRWRTGFIVQCCSTVVDSRVDRYRPHWGSVSIAITIIIRSSIATSPNIERA